MGLGRDGTSRVTAAPNRAGTSPKGSLHPGKRPRAHLGEQHMQEVAQRVIGKETGHNQAPRALSASFWPLSQKGLMPTGGTGHGTDLMACPHPTTTQLSPLPAHHHRALVNPAPSTSQSPDPQRWGSAPLWEEPQHRS